MTAVPKSRTHSTPISQEQTQPMIELHLTGILGTKITIHVKDESEMLQVMRQYGRRGWTSGDIPAGGLVLPLAMADTFDWYLIGAREFVNQDGEKCVFHKGQVYKRRELEEVDTKKLKLPKIVKYSRGARPTDPDHLKEGEESVRYVTLITFRGNGRPLESYQDPEKVAAQQHNTQQ
ncbi:single-stranded DNA-binding protein [Deinococcus misasensis]|uniref:single-stranded DNA-binding protein n=1 Tax=Deinococcus misasensis TaxID=392413 RepID=UPI000AF1E01B|nr:single-stranded DNA-binding protein [Deinococcus misasensis]